MPHEVINDEGDRVIMDDPTYVSYYSPIARFVWTILGIVNALLAIRFLLKLFGANAAADFSNFVYNVTNPLVAPFTGVIRSSLVGPGVAEWSTIIAMVIYWLLAWAIVRLFTINRPMARY